MPNPFHNAPLADLKAMVENGDLSDPELDALCAAACDGEWVARFGDQVSPFPSSWRAFSGGPATGAFYIKDMPRYTSDWREAGRLLVWLLDHYREKKSWDVAEEFLRPFLGSCGTSPKIRRYITEAAVCAALAMMEGKNATTKSK